MQKFGLPNSSADGGAQPWVQRAGGQMGAVRCGWSVGIRPRQLGARGLSRIDVFVVVLFVGQLFVKVVSLSKWSAQGVVGAARHFV